MQTDKLLQFLFETSFADEGAPLEELFERLGEIEDLETRKGPLDAALKKLGLKGATIDVEGVRLDFETSEDYSAARDQLFTADAINALAELGWVPQYNGDTAPEVIDPPRYSIHFLALDEGPEPDAKQMTDKQAKKDIERVAGHFVGDEGPEDTTPEKLKKPKTDESLSVQDEVSALLGEKKKVGEGRQLSVPDRHQLKIARDTLRMSDVGASVMGGMTKEEARRVIYRLTGRHIKDDPALKDEPRSESLVEGLLGDAEASWPEDEAAMTFQSYREGVEEDPSAESYEWNNDALNRDIAHMHRVFDREDDRDALRKRYDDEISRLMSEWKAQRRAGGAKPTSEGKDAADTKGKKLRPPKDSERQDPLAKLLKHPRGGPGGTTRESRSVRDMVDRMLSEDGTVSEMASTPARARFGAFRPENQRMMDFLKDNGIDGVHVKFLRDGSMRGSWRIWQPGARWSKELADKFNELGFTEGSSRDPLNEFSGNGGDFSIFVRGHDELLREPAAPMKESLDPDVALALVPALHGEQGPEAAEEAVAALATLCADDARVTALLPRLRGENGPEDAEDAVEEFKAIFS